MNIYPRRINIGKPNNIRELGGYMRKDKKITKYGEFLRSDLLHNLSDEELQFLVDYGVKTVIDLRKDDEIAEYPSSLANVAGIQYFHMPLLSDQSPELSAEFDLGDLYINMLEHSENIGPLFNCMADNLEGTLLFNCTVGKDRTGITACLLLMLAGIDKNDIVADYQVSFTYVRSFFYELQKKFPEIKMHFAMSNPEFIERFMETIEKNFGGAEDFLSAKAVPAKNINSIKNKII